MHDKAKYPAGWRPLELDDAFLDRVGPMFIADPGEADADEPAQFGIRIEQHHCSFAGSCHGGMLATILDIALGRGVAMQLEGAHAPTVTLTIDFMRPAQVGDWLETRTRILRRTRSMVFCDTLLLGPNGIVARASAIFKLSSPVRREG